MFGQPSYTNYPYTVPTQPQNNGINWVQGLAGAKSFLVAPGQSVVLMDSENDIFYVKAADASGMPMPLRIFDYKERKTETVQPGNYVTRDEFEKRLAEIANGKQSISANEQQ